MRIFLIGFMGSGKTTLAKKMAKRFGLQHIDTDKYIIEKTGLSINDIFEKYGEKYFRKIEKETLQEIIQLDNIIVSTGGGLPCIEKVMDLINECGKSIYLKLSAKTLVQRVSYNKEKRPLIKNIDSQDSLLSFVSKTLQERDPIYAKAHFTIDGVNNRTAKLEDVIKNLLAEEINKLPR